jgi:hypothetical protein
MDPAIPAHLKKYIKKARATRVKENKISYKSPKQVAKQNQIVIIGDTSGRKRQYIKRGTASSGGGGGGVDYPRIVYIPQSIPNMSIPMSNPQEIRQPIPPSVHGFQSQPVYRNPFRMQPFRTALNPPPFTENKPLEHTADKSIFTAPQSPPPPLEPDIVQEPNFLDIRSTPIVALNPVSPGIDIIPPSTTPVQPEPFSPVQLKPVTPIATEVDLSREPSAVNAFRVLPIMINQPPNQGMTQNLAVNQLNSETMSELKAYQDFGGYDASTDAERMRLAKQLSGGDFYAKRNRPSTSSSESEREREVIAYRPRGASESGGGGGGGGGTSNKGRPFTALTTAERDAIEIYLYGKNDVQLKKGFNQSEKAEYKRGRLLLSQNKSNNPEVIALKQNVMNNIAKGGRK